MERKLSDQATYAELPKYWQRVIGKQRNECANLRVERNALRAELEALRATVSK